METSIATIPGQRTAKRRVCFSLPVDLVDGLADLRQKHRVNLSEFTEVALRDSLRRHARRKPSPSKPAA